MRPLDKLHIFAKPADLFPALADDLLERAHAALAARGRFSLVLSGGNTPNQLHQLLTGLPYLEKMPWERTFVFWGDERVVPRQDTRNNAHVAMELFLSRVPIPAANIFPIPVELAPAAAAAAYFEQITAFFAGEPPAFDVVILGMGDNGHTASLFPGMTLIEEKTAGVKAEFIPEVEMWRVTMTAPLINQAHSVHFLVTGAGKANMLRRVLHEPYTPQLYPAQLVQPHNGILHWWLDAAATAEI